MTRIAMNELTTYRWSFEEDVQHYAAAGLDGIGVWRQKLSDYGDEKGAELLSERQLQVSSLLWAGGFTGSEGRSHKESVQDAREAIQLAAQLKAACLIIYSGARAGHTHNHARRLFRSAISDLLPIASEFGVVLAVEPMHSDCGADFTFLHQLDETLQLIDEFDSPQLKLAFDTYHMTQGEFSCDTLADLTSRLALVQLGDAKQPPNGEPNRCFLGGGSLPVEQVVGALVTAGYDGFLEIELMGEDIEAADYHELVTRSKQTVEGILNASASP